MNLMPKGINQGVIKLFMASYNGADDARKYSGDAS